MASALKLSTGVQGLSSGISSRRSIPFSSTWVTRTVTLNPVSSHAAVCHVQLNSQARRPTTTTCNAIFPFDLAWNPNIDAASLAPQLFAGSLFPYLAFLFFLTKSGKVPKLTVIGFWFLLAFVGATIPAGIYAKIQYGKALANVDWLHGAAESLLTITNLLIVLGLRQGIREEEAKKAAAAAAPVSEQSTTTADEKQKATSV